MKTPYFLKDYLKKANEYMENHWRYHNHLHHDRHQNRLKLTAKYCIGKTLEVGCANGFSTHTMQEHNPEAKFEGIEPTDWGYKEAYSTYPAIKFYKGLGENLPFRDGSYDTVLLGEIIEHVKYPRMLTDEAWRVCSKRLIVTTPTQPHPDPDHKRFYSLDDLRDFLKPYGESQVVGLDEYGERTERVYFQIRRVDK